MGKLSAAAMSIFTCIIVLEMLYTVMRGHKSLLNLPSRPWAIRQMSARALQLVHSLNLVKVYTTHNWHAKSLMYYSDILLSYITDLLRLRFLESAGARISGSNSNLPQAPSVTGLRTQVLIIASPALYHWAILLPLSWWCLLWSGISF